MSCWDNIYIGVPRQLPAAAACCGHLCLLHALTAVIWSLLTEVMAVYVTLHLNGGCTPWSTDACWDGWPNHTVHEAQRWYMILMFQV